MIRFASEEDILLYTRFTLPESLDPPYDQRNAAWSDSTKAARPLWFNVRLDHFAARIIRPDGTWGEVGAFASIERQQVRTARTMETAWTYVLDLQAIAPGDVVEVRWKYMVPYDLNGQQTGGWRAFEWMDNWARLTSWRIFFHGDLPIRHQRVELKYHRRHGLRIESEAFYHLSEELEDERIAVWEQRDLPACMGEVNARPGIDLPHINITLEPEDYRYWARDRLSGFAQQQPYWSYVIGKRESSALWWKRVAMKHVPDHQNALFTAFVDRTTAAIPDTLRARRMEAIHDHIAEDFTYDNDRLWYQGMDNDLARMGDQVNERRIREISRYDLYAKLVYTLGSAYSTAYLMDKRIGTMGGGWMSPLWDSDFLIGVKDVGHTMWMHPKRSGTGLFADELPFYWQGAPALISSVELLIGNLPPPPPLFLELPSDAKESNVRVSEIRLDISPKPTKAMGSARVLLSGQFSTLGRSAYRDLKMDPTVHPFYGDVLQRLSYGTNSDWHVRSISKEAPFRFMAETTVASPILEYTTLDSSWTITLSEMSTHAVPTNFAATGRDLPFYWDFEQDDRSIIDLHFDRSMEFLNIAELNVSVSTPNATLVRSVVSDSPAHVRIESLLKVTGVRELPEDAQALEQLIRLAHGDGFVLRGKPMSAQP